MSTAPHLRSDAFPPSPGGDLPPVPAVVLSADVDLDGRRQAIPTDGPIWRVRQSADGGDVLRLNVGALTAVDGGPGYSERAAHLVRLYLADRLQRKKAFTVQGDLEALRRFQAWASARKDSSPSFEWTDLSEGTARAFLEYGLSRPVAGNDFARLRHFYGWGVAKQFPDFDSELLRVLRSIRAPGNVKGAAVRFRDPRRGPFDAQEQSDLRAAATNPQVPAEARAILMLFLEWGSNPNQFARLRNSDLKAYPSPQDPRDYKLSIPRNKKGTSNRETRARRISQRLGSLLFQLQRSGPDDPLLHWLSGDSPRQGIADSLRRARRIARIRSRRLGTPLHINPRRFRYTLATESAAQGASEEQIADILDHTDTQHVRVYTQFGPEGMRRASQAIDGILEPIVDAFLGLVIDPAGGNPFPAFPEQVIPGASPHLPEFGLDLGGIGLCGHDTAKHGLCGFMQPLQCYRCRKFAAFKDGPHEQVLAALERARERLRETADARIAMQLDEIIAAVGQLLEQLHAEHTEPALVQIGPGKTRAGGNR